MTRIGVIGRAAMVALVACSARSAHGDTFGFQGWGNDGFGQATPRGDASSGVASVAAGTGFTVAVRKDGSVVAWGNNRYMQMVVPKGLSGVAGVAAGDSHVVALKSDGSVVAWGSSGPETSVPPGLTGVTAVAAGYTNSLALKSDGTVVGWGSNPSLATTVPAGLTGVTAIAAASDHSVALKGDGTVVAWGSNLYGQSSVPGGLSNVIAVAAGAFHTVALRSDGSVVAWGLNNQGQTTVPSGLSGVTAIAAGAFHTLALKSDGTVVAWGYDNYGQASVPADLSGVTAVAAGDYHSVALRSDGTLVTWGNNSIGQTTIPTGLSGAIAVAEGYAHTLVLRKDGTVVVWGMSEYGQLNIPSNLGGVTAITAGYLNSFAVRSDGTAVGWGYDGQGQTTVPAGLTGVIAIAAGASHTVALKADGTIVAWGLNNYGEATVPAGLTGVVAIAAGSRYTVALKNDGTMVAWGQNDAGQATVPAGLEGVIAIAACPTGRTTMALKKDGTVVAWGENSYGKANVPVDLSGVIAISQGEIHAVALRSDGTVVAWGGTYFGATNVPAGLSGVAAIAAGGSSTVVLRAQTRTLSASWTGQGTVTSSPAGIDCGAACQAEFPAGGQVSLQATPASGYAFTGWSGACGGTGDCVVTMDAAKTATATFEPLPLSIQNLYANPAKTAVFVIWNTPGVPSTARVIYGLTSALESSSGVDSNLSTSHGVVLTGLPSCSDIFYQAASTSPDGQSATSEVQVVKTLGSGSIRVSLSGTGSGSVSIEQPPGNVAATCSTGTPLATCLVDYCAAAVLTAVPAPGSAFSGWSGACTGSEPTCSRARWPSGVTATFEALWPRIVQVSPMSLPVTGGVVVTLNGTNFAPGATVALNGQAVTVAGVSSTAITFTAPAGSGSATITVTNPDGRSDTFAGGLTYIAPPSIVDVVPASGALVGGNSVSIGGLGFQSNAEVMFGTFLGSTMSVSSTGSEILVVVPAGASPGPVTVTVTNPDGQVARLPAAYSYVDATGTTATGANVSVQPTVTNPADGITNPVTLTFDDVTSGGTTTVETISGPGPNAIPTGYRVGSPPVYYELTSTATFAGFVEVCFHYSVGSYGREATLRLFHGVNGRWEDITTSKDDVNDIICGKTSSLSPFAIMEPIFYSLQVAMTGVGGVVATVGTAPPITCNSGSGTCSSVAQHGTTVTLSAASTDATQYVFKRWSGCSSGSGATCVVPMYADRQVQAEFEPARFPLTVNFGGTGTGTITATAGGTTLPLNCTASACTASVPNGASVILTENPGTGLFQGWGILCAGTATTCSFTMNSAKTALATFGPLTYPINVTVAGAASGTVTSNVVSGSQVSCTTGSTAGCSASFPSGSSVTLTATWNAAQTIFKGWGGGICKGTTPTCVVSVNAAKGVAATFDPATYPLSVTNMGAGSGTVTAPGISCRSGSTAGCSAQETNGAMITLTAAPTDGNSVFKAWSGCSSASGTSCTVYMTAARSVTAAFEPATYPLTLNLGGTGTGAVSGVTWASCTATTCTGVVANGATVALTATPGAGSTFKGWGIVCAGTAGCSFKMNSPKTVSATFSSP